MNNPAGCKPVEILLVEDNPGDVRLAREALKDANIYHNLRVAGDGVEALTILRREGAHLGEPLPDIIFLDLDLPRKDGREVLAEIKADDALKLIPVVVQTTSTAEKDIAMAYDLRANCYITKPMNVEQLVRVVKSIESFWFTVDKLPGG
jgi:chemotaxis family two-component system response regulator Rcp1